MRRPGAARRQIRIPFGVAQPSWQCPFTGGTPLARQMSYNPPSSSRVASLISYYLRGQSRVIAALFERLAGSSGLAGLAWTEERKVRTPLGSVLANGEGRRWMDAQASRTPPARKVPQKTYRLKPALARACDWVRVKRCGLRKRPQSKSAPLGQRCSRQGKPHTEQDQIGGEERPAPS